MIYTELTQKVGDAQGETREYENPHAEILERAFDRERGSPWPSSSKSQRSLAFTEHVPAAALKCPRLTVITQVGSQCR